jgi:hypothetical protein
MRKTPSPQGGPHSPLKKATIAYAILLLGGFAFIYLLHKVANHEKPKPFIRTAPALPLSAEALEALLPLVPLNDRGRVYTKDGVTITWPELATSYTNSQQQYDSLLNVINRWNPDDVDPPPKFTETLQHFNYSCPEQRETARQFLEAEKPFKIYGVPEFDAVSEKWTDQYLRENLFGTVEKGDNNHFMFYKGTGKNIPGWKIPNPKVKMTVPEWQDLAIAADKNKLSSEDVHYYLTTGVPKHDKRTFIGKDLSLFSTKEANLFVREPSKNKGIQCRFGMR